MSDDDQILNEELDKLPDQLREGFPTYRKRVKRDGVGPPDPLKFRSLNESFPKYRKKVKKGRRRPPKEEDILNIAPRPSYTFAEICDMHKEYMLLSAKRLKLFADKRRDTTNEGNSNFFDEHASKSGNNKTGSNDRRIVTKQMSSSTSNKSQYNSVKHKTTIISASIMTKAAEEKYFAEKNVITTRSMVKTRNNNSSADPLKSGDMKTHSKSKTSTSTSNSNAGPSSIKSLPSVSQKISNKGSCSLHKTQNEIATVTNLLTDRR